MKTNKEQLGHVTEYVYPRTDAVLAGEQLGGFKLGSTVVVLFEAPSDFQFIVEEGHKVLVGEALGAVFPKSPPK